MRHVIRAFMKQNFVQHLIASEDQLINSQYNFFGRIFVTSLLVEICVWDMQITQPPTSYFIMVAMRLRVS